MEFNDTKPSFVTGIVSAELFSRIDLNKIKSGVKQCQNFEIRPSGGAAYRAGTEYICPVKNKTNNVALIPFIESRDNGYCLEFGDKYIRFYKGGGKFIVGGEHYEIESPYLENELSALKYVQYRDQMVIVHPNHAPAILKRNETTRLYFKYEEQTITKTYYAFTQNYGYVPSVFYSEYETPVSLSTIYYAPPLALETTSSDGFVSLDSSSYTGFTYDGSTISFEPSDGDHTKYRRTSEKDFTETKTTTISVPSTEDDYDYYEDVGLFTLTDMVFNPIVPSIETVTIAAGTAKNTNTVVPYDRWQYAVSVVDPDGNEGLATKSNVISSDIDLVNQNINVSFNSPDEIKEGSKFNIYRIYRGNFYLIYQLDYVSGTSQYTLKDVSFQADTTKSIKELFDGFDDGNYPAAVGIWNQRLIFGNTKKKPNALYGSRVGKFDDFTTTILNNADEAFELELFATSTDVITDVIPMDDLIVLTENKIWRVVGTSPANMSAYIESYTGSSGLRPFAYKKSILFIDSSLNTVSNFVYSYELNGYVGQNLDILCRDLMEGYTLKDVTFRDSPYGVMYVVRSDGIMLAMTYLKEENVSAWQLHSTDGKFLNVCNIDRSQYDDIYVVVERDGIRYVELMKKIIDASEDIDDSWHLDCASRQIQTQKLYCWKRIISDDDAEYLWTEDEIPTVGDMAYENLDMYSGTAIESVSDGQITVSSFDYQRSSGNDGIKQVYIMGGLSRFAGKKIRVMADTNEFKDVEVSQSGEIEIGIPASNILAGLPYDGILEPISTDITFKSGGTSVGFTRRINNATIRYYRTRGLWYGTDENNLFQIKPYTSETFGEFIPLETATQNLNIQDSYKEESSFEIQQKSPFPAVIQSITLEYDYGEKN